MTSDMTRPSGFADFIGEEKVKKVLEILCRSAKKKGQPIGHILLSGGPGLGKTSLARILAATLGSTLHEVIASNLQTTDQMVKHLTKLKPLDILFIDEVHGLSRSVEEILYGALEDRKISVSQQGYDDLMKSLGMGKKNPTTVMVDLPPFTCIACTTLSGLVSDPLRSRFVQCLTLEPYSDDELTRIILIAASKMEFPMANEIAMEVAKRSRATARNAIMNLRWFAEYCEGTEVNPGKEAIEAAFALKDIDPNGLTKVDRNYISVLTEAGTPLGVATIAASVLENEETLLLAIEPFLLRGGWIRKTARGRVATQKAFDLVNGKEATNA